MYFMGAKLSVALESPSERKGRMEVETRPGTMKMDSSYLFFGNLLHYFNL